jgi:hypothetical protein
MASPSYGENDDICEQCEVDTYCPGNHTYSCPDFSHSRKGSGYDTDCVCKPGYVGENGGECTECIADSFCSGGNSSTACPGNSESPPGSNSTLACICKAGWYGAPGGGCRVCEAGSFCHTGDKTRCPTYSWSVSGSSERSDCSCIAGYTDNEENVCISCAQGTYKSKPGDQSCTTCPAGTYSNARAATSNNTCSRCPNNMFSDAGSTNCTCNHGYDMDEDRMICEACHAGTYKDWRGNSPCIDCGEDTYSDTSGADICSPCPSNSVSLNGSADVTDCMCRKGYSGMDGQECNSCGAGTYKEKVGGSSCIACARDTYSSVSGSISTRNCLQCPGKTTSPSGSSTEEKCVCPNGYTGDYQTGCTMTKKMWTTVHSDEGISTLTFEVHLDLRIDDFKGYLRTAFLEGVADALDIPTSSVKISSIRDIVTIRRLLAPTTDVTTVALVPTESAESVAAITTRENINNGFESDELQASYVHGMVITKNPKPPRRTLTAIEQHLISGLETCPCVS